MNKLYRVQRHDGGWVYEVNGAFSATFRTREEARIAARRADEAHEGKGAERRPQAPALGKSEP